MKERKILTKLGIIFGIIDLLLILFGVIFLKPKKVLAEETTTPDYFINNELYMFDAHTNIPPNFETGYYDKVLITENDISNDSDYFGWYRNLGYRQLIIPYFQPNEGEDNVYVMFGVKLFGCLAKTFSIAYEVSSPMLLDFYLFFSDGTYEEWNTEDNGFGRQILSISPANLDKNCLYFCWQADSPDYVPSLKFMGISDSYDFGYNDGFRDGHRDGYTTGYNGGYQAGYRAGTSSEDVIYTTIYEYNQLILNGNFFTASNWIISPGSFSIYQNTGIFNITQQNGYILSSLMDIPITHKVYLRFDIQTTNANNQVLARFNNEGSQAIVLNNVDEFTEIDKIITITNGSDNFFQIIDQRDNNIRSQISLKNVIAIDLTKMYGEGKEPTIEQARNIFYNDYYEYSIGTPIQIGYYTGYIEGKEDGINEGINIGETNQINMSWIQSIFQAMQGFFNIQIFPRVTLGIIVGIPFIISLAWFVIKMFRGGGGGED